MASDKKIDEKKKLINVIKYYLIMSQGAIWV